MFDNCDFVKKQLDFALIVMAVLMAMCEKPKVKNLIDMNFKNLSKADKAGKYCAETFGAHTYPTLTSLDTIISPYIHV